MKKKIFYITVIICFFIFNFFYISSAKVLEDGIELDIQTDKENYKITDEVKATIFIKNTNQYDIKNVKLESILPDGLSVKQETITNKQLEVLKSGETESLEVILVNSDIASGKLPKTGENIIKVLIGIVILIIGILLIKFYINNKNVTEIFILIFTISLLTSINSETFAETISRIVKTDTNIIMGELTYKLEAKAEYELITNDYIGLTVDNKDGTTEEIFQTITGSFNENVEIKKITYKVMEEVNNWQEGTNGEAIMTGNRWSIEKLKLKIGTNKIIITAIANDGTMQYKELNLKYYDGESYNVVSEDISFDDKTNQYYANDIVALYLKEGVSNERLSEIVKSINGEIVGKSNIVRKYEVKVNKKTLGELKELVEELEKLEEVNLADISFAYKGIATAGENEWSGVKWNEGNPNKSDVNWWMECVQGYSSRKYQEENTEKFEKIHVGVVDSEFNLNHPEFDGVDIGYIGDTMITGYHGTMTSSIICGNDDGKGIFGILNKCRTTVYAYSEIINQDELDEEGNAIGVYESWNVIDGVRNNILAGAKAVNLSACVNKGKEVLDDYSIVKYGRTASYEIGVLLSQGYDFVVVQSAGNGGIDAINSGWYDSITVDNCITTYASVDDILGRVLVVGGIDDNQERFGASNNGNQVSIYAPGCSNMYQVGNNGEGYKIGDGYTSFATPIVTGICGAVWATNPNLTGAEVKNIVCTSYRYAVEGRAVADAKLSLEKALGVPIPSYGDNSGDENPDKPIIDEGEKIDIQAQSKWEGISEEEAKSLKVEYTLYNNNIEVSKMLLQGNEIKTFSNVNKFDEYGQEIHYSVKETGIYLGDTLYVENGDIDAYMLNTIETDGVITIVNKARKIEVQKNWKGITAEEAKCLKIEVDLYKENNLITRKEIIGNDTEVFVIPIKIDEKNDNKYTVKESKIYEDVNRDQTFSKSLAENEEELKKYFVKQENIDGLERITNKILYLEKEVIPIYTPYQFLSIGSGVIITIDGKSYKFTADANYQLMNDIDLQNKVINGIEKITGVIEGNGYTIKNAKISMTREVTKMNMENIASLKEKIVNEGYKGNLGIYLATGTQSLGSDVLTDLEQANEEKVMNSTAFATLALAVSNNEWVRTAHIKDGKPYQLIAKNFWNMSNGNYIVEDTNACSPEYPISLEQYEEYKNKWVGYNYSENTENFSSKDLIPGDILISEVNLENESNNSVVEIYAGNGYVYSGRKEALNTVLTEISEEVKKGGRVIRIAEKEEKENVGLFGKCTGTIMNLNVENVIPNYNPNDDIEYSNVKSIGTIVGLLENGNLINCTANGNMYLLGENTGGLIGKTVGNIEVSNCINNQKTIKEIINSKNIGGIVGYIQDEALINECKNTGDISALIAGERRTGGIVGYVNPGETVISNCTNDGEIHSKDIVAEIAGLIGDNIIVENCKGTNNKGDDMPNGILYNRIGVINSANIIEIGDYVNYDANSNGEQSYTTTETETGSNIERIFKSSDNMKWRVLNINIKTGEIELISAAPTEEIISFQGKNGIENSDDVLKSVADVYGKGKCAAEARCITEEEVKKYTSDNLSDYFDLYRYKIGNQEMCKDLIYKDSNKDNKQYILSNSSWENEGFYGMSGVYNESIESKTHNIQGGITVIVRLKQGTKVTGKDISGAWNLDADSQYTTIKEINYIEDLVELSKAVQNGKKFSQTKFILQRNLNFCDESSYRNPDATIYGDINGNGTIEGIKTELTTAKGFLPIGYGNPDENFSGKFTGNFSGNFHEISNLMINRECCVGFFGDVEDAVIENLTLSGDVYGESASGFVALANNNLYIYNCINNVNVNGIFELGGFVGNTYLNEFKMQKCINNGKITQTQGKMVAKKTGGLAGNVYAMKCVISDCVNNGEINCVTGTGGIIGMLTNWSGMMDGNANIYNCKNNGNIVVNCSENSENNDISGIGGYIISDMLTIKECENKGNITIYKAHEIKSIAGVIGTIYSRVNLDVDTVNNSGKIIINGDSKVSNIGGIFGNVYGYGDTNLLNCKNSGDIMTNCPAVSCMGGVIGLLICKDNIGEIANSGKLGFLGENDGTINELIGSRESN